MPFSAQLQSVSVRSHKISLFLSQEINDFLEGYPVVCHMSAMRVTSCIRPVHQTSRRGSRAQGEESPKTPSTCSFQHREFISHQFEKRQQENESRRGAGSFELDGIGTEKGRSRSREAFLVGQS